MSLLEFITARECKLAINRIAFVPGFATEEMRNLYATGALYNILFRYGNILEL